MKIFVKELGRWEEITPKNKEILRKFGYIKEVENDVKDNQGTSEYDSGNTKRTRKRKSS